MRSKKKCTWVKDFLVVEDDDDEEVGLDQDDEEDDANVNDGRDQRGLDEDDDESELANELADEPGKDDRVLVVVSSDDRIFLVEMLGRQSLIVRESDDRILIGIVLDRRIAYDAKEEDGAADDVDDGDDEDEDVDPVAVQGHVSDDDVGRLSCENDDRSDQAEEAEDKADDCDDFDAELQGEVYAAVLHLVPDDEKVKMDEIELDTAHKRRISKELVVGLKFLIKFF